jgi:hypothetical protein
MDLVCSNVVLEVRNLHISALRIYHCHQNIFYTEMQKNSEDYEDDCKLVTGRTDLPEKVDKTLLY